jgi:hypothetical protein
MASQKSFACSIDSGRRNLNRTVSAGDFINVYMGAKPLTWAGSPWWTWRWFVFLIRCREDAVGIASELLCMEVI